MIYTMVDRLPTRTQTPTFLAIGYGNDLRSDDGVGQRVAEEMALWGLPNLRSLSVHQLTPELAESLSEVDVAIFIDAYPAAEGQGVQVVGLDCGEITQKSSGNVLDHSSDPRSLLTLAEVLYGNAPKAWLVAIPAIDFQFGETFSSVTERGMTDAIDAIADILCGVRSRSRFSATPNEDAR